MACNTCAKSYTLFRKEKGCPSCGFSYCSNCLKFKTFVQKLNREAKVCVKCKNDSKENKVIEPPDAYLKRVEMQSNNLNKSDDPVDQEIQKRLLQLKKDKSNAIKEKTEDVIDAKLKNLKGPQPSTSDAELQMRLAKLKGVPDIGPQKKPEFISSNYMTEQEQANNLMKQYMEQANIDQVYKEGYEKQIADIENRIKKLRDNGTGSQAQSIDATQNDLDDEAEFKKIIEKVLAESMLDYKKDVNQQDDESKELPFCEICNEDASMRCLGCQYLFCKRCFLEHKDDDDGCNRYEAYPPPKT